MKPIFPAYGRELMRRRQAGFHPVEPVLVAVGFWPRLGFSDKEWSRERAVVVTDDLALGRLELRMLTGLHILIACEASRFARAKELAQLVWMVRPAAGNVWVFDFETPIFWHWQDLTKICADYWMPLRPLFSEHVARHREPSAA